MAEVWYVDDLPPRPARPPVAGEVSVGTLVVGGGLAGLSTAVSLSERGDNDVLLVEARRLGHGASGRNGGFVFGGYSLSPAALLAAAGPDKARRMMAWTGEGVATVRRRIEHHGIDCRRTEGGVIWADWFRRAGPMQDMRAFLSEHFGIDWPWLEPDAVRERTGSHRYGGALLEPDAFHFQPLRYVHGLADVLEEADVAVAENTPVTGLERYGTGWWATVPDGRVHAARVVIATGGYGPWPLPGRFRPHVPIATHAGVTAPLGPEFAHILPGLEAVYDSRFAFDYYHRTAGDRLLWGGRISVRRPAPAGIRRQLRRDIRRVFPELADIPFERAWSGWMSYARHQMPILAEPERGLWYALAFGGHGMAVTALAGEVLAEAMDGDRSRLADFAAWPPVRAWGPLGRLAAQSVYSTCQVRDAVRAGLTRRAGS